MPNSVVGTTLAVEQPSGYGFQGGRGYYQKRRWKTSNDTVLGTLISYLSSNGYSYDVTRVGPISEVEGRLDYESGGAPTTTPISTVWERDIKVTEKELLESNLSLVAYDASTFNELHRATILLGLKNDVQPAATGLSGNPLKVYTLMFNKVKSVLVYQPVIRRTKICSNSYATAESDTNMGKILSASQMSSLEGAPGGLLYALPTTPGISGRTDIKLKPGYLKMPARVQQQGDGRWQISQEFDYGEWAEYLYADAS